jgi:hypothetical protein
MADSVSTRREYSEEMSDTEEMSDSVSTRREYAEKILAAYEQNTRDPIETPIVDFIEKINKGFYPADKYIINDEVVTYKDPEVQNLVTEIYQKRVDEYFSKTIYPYLFDKTALTDVSERSMYLRRYFYKHKESEVVTLILATCCDASGWNEEKLTKVWSCADEGILGLLFAVQREIRHSIIPKGLFEHLIKMSNPRFNLIYKELKRYFADNSYTLQCQAAEDGKEDLLNFLIESAGGKCSPDAAISALANGHFTLAKKLIDKGYYQHVTWYYVGKHSSYLSMHYFPIVVKNIDVSYLLRGALYSGFISMADTIIEQRPVKLDKTFYCTNSFEGYDWLDRHNCPKGAGAFVHLDIRTELVKNLLERGTPTDGAVRKVLETRTRLLVPVPDQELLVRNARILIEAGVPYELDDLRAYSHPLNQLLYEEMLAKESAKSNLKAVAAELNSILKKVEDVRK